MVWMSEHYNIGLRPLVLNLGCRQRHQQLLPWLFNSVQELWHRPVGDTTGIFG